MKKSSSIDNPFFRLMGAIGDLVVLNILWLVVLAAGIAALAGLRAASAQDDVFTGLLAAASFLLLAGVCCCGCWGLALLARFTYRHGLPALLDGARMTVANLLPTVGILVLLAWMPLLWVLAPGWFIYLLLPLFLAGGSVTALGMAALMRPAVARMEQAGRKPEPPRGQTPACIWYLHRV